MTLREATENGVDYWEFFVLIDGKQILVAGKREERVHYLAATNIMRIGGKLSAPADLEAVSDGNGWYRFELGDGHLMVWSTKGGAL